MNMDMDMDQRYYGQYWTINDCLYRNKALDTSWLLFTDLDEIYTSMQYPTLPALAKAFGGVARIGGGGGTKQQQIDSIFLGNYGVSSHACSEVRRDPRQFSCPALLFNTAVQSANTDV